MTAEEHNQGGAPLRRNYRLRQDARAIGWREWLAIPEWEVARIKAKIDTGARTSALHADSLHYFTRGGVEMVRFKVHPHQRSFRNTVTVEAAIVDKRVVRSSNGEEDLRPVVRTHVEIHGVCWPIEVTLARRKLMGFRMLLGREAMWDRFIVDPSRSFLGGQPCMPFDGTEPEIKPRRRVKRTVDAVKPVKTELHLAEQMPVKHDTDSKTRARAK